MRPRDWLLLAALALLWAASFFLVEIALTAIAPLTVAAFRIALAAAALLALAAIKRAFGGGRAGELRAAIKNRWRAYLAMGLFNNAIPFACFAWGQQYIDSGLAAVMNATTPLATVLLAAAIGEEKLSAPRLAGVAAGVGGVAVLVGPIFAGDLSAGLGALAALGAAISYAVSALLGRRRLALSAPPLENAACMLVGATVILAPIALLLESPWQAPPTAPALAAAAALGLFSTALAYLVYFRLLATVGATNTMLVTFLIPPGTILLGALLLNEQFGADFFAGAGLILVGLIFADRRLRAKIFLRRDQQPPA